MPQKLNHAREMQNYVPKGNEAGGQYGDDDGNNINYHPKKPRKPRRSKKDPGIGIITSKPKEGLLKGLKEGFGNTDPTSEYNEEKAKEKQFNIIDKSRIIKKSKEKLKEWYSNGTQEGKELLDKYSTTVEYKNDPDGSYCEWKRAIDYKTLSIRYTTSDVYFGFNTETDRDQSAIFWHENGHSIDRNGRYSVDYKEESGLSMYDTLKRECADRDTLIERIKSDFEAETSELKAKMDEARHYVDGVKLKVLKEIRIKDYKNSEGKTDFFAYDEAVDKRCNEIAPDFTKKVGELRELAKKYNFEREKWADVSDAVSGMTFDQERISNYGHKRSYWSQDPHSRAHEFFAEYFSSIANNEKSEVSKKSHELMKKYFPETTSFCDRIFEKMKKGEMKND